MAKGPSPLLGFNNNVRYKGREYHIQTEDSGLQHPHIITHLFADGGRIVSSRKTSYADVAGDEGYAPIVKKMMQDQHKALFIALRAGEFDAELGITDTAAPAPAAPPKDIHSATTATGQTSAPISVPIDLDALDRAAAASAAASAATRDSLADGFDRAAAAIERAERVSSPGRYATTRPAKERPSKPEVESIFGSDLVSERSLDEVILGYLADDLEDGNE